MNSIVAIEVATVNGGVRIEWGNRHQITLDHSMIERVIGWKRDGRVTL